VAHKQAVIMHAMWVDGTFFCGDPDASKADASARRRQGEEAAGGRCMTCATPDQSMIDRAIGAF
jgi:hypothetical protein